MSALADMPNWPALMNTTVSRAYLGNSERTLIALVAAGFLAPVTRGHCNTQFRRVAIDAALARAEAIGPEWQAGIPASLDSVAAAEKWHKENKKKAA